MSPEERAEMEAELADMRRHAEMLAHAPRNPVGENWQAKRAERLDVWNGHIARVEQNLEETS